MTDKQTNEPSPEWTKAKSIQEAKDLLAKQPPTPEKAFKGCPVIRVLGDKKIREAWLISSTMAWIKS